MWVSRNDEHGTRTMVVRAASAGVRRLQHAIDHLAHLLGQHGDPAQRTASLDGLQADAAVLLANPLAALKLMIGAEEHDCSQGVADASRSAGPNKVRPTAVVYLHLTPGTLLGGGVARAEDLGALTRSPCGR